MSCPNCTCKIEPVQHVNRVRIMQKDPAKVLEGDNTLVSIDGYNIHNLISMKIEIPRHGFAKMSLEFDVAVDLHTSIVKDLEITTNASKIVHSSGEEA